MKQQPRWADSLRFWLTDKQYDNARWDWEWKLRGRVEDLGVWALCRVLGHTPSGDAQLSPNVWCVYCQKDL